MKSTIAILLAALCLGTLFGIGMGKGFVLHSDSSSSSRPFDLSASERKSIGAENALTIYTLPTCPYCKTLKLSLRKKKIAFTEFDLSLHSEIREALAALSVNSVPFAVVGNQGLAGLDLDWIEQRMAGNSQKSAPTN